MAIGILFISKTPGYNVDLMSYLFGSILLIARDELYIMAGLDVAIVLIVGLLYKQLQAICFDEEFARLRGVPVELIYFVLLLLVALTVVVLIQVVGLILVIALLTLPAAIAGQYLSSLGKIMVAAVLLGMFFVLGGLFVSFEPDLPSGATIILIAGLSYLFSTGLQLGLRRMG
jgi:zinc transport system permease protein